MRNADRRRERERERDRPAGNVAMLMSSQLGATVANAKRKTAPPPTQKKPKKNEPTKTKKNQMTKKKRNEMKRNETKGDGAHLGRRPLRTTPAVGRRRRRRRRRLMDERRDALFPLMRRDGISIFRHLGPHEVGNGNKSAAVDPSRRREFPETRSLRRRRRRRRFGNRRAK